MSELPPSESKYMFIYEHFPDKGAQFEQIFQSLTAKTQCSLLAG